MIAAIFNPLDSYTPGCFINLNEVRYYISVLKQYCTVLYCTVLYCNTLNSSICQLCMYFTSCYLLYVYMNSQDTNDDKLTNLLSEIT